MTAIKKIVDRVVEWVCIILLGIMTVLVTYQVITRYFFNEPSAISEVVSKYLFVWLVLFCGAYVFGLREHMNIGFLREKMPAKMRIIVEMLSELLIALFAGGVMVWGGYSGALKQMVQLDSALQIPVGVIYAAIPIAGVLMLFYFVCNELELVKKMTGAGESAQ